MSQVQGVSESQTGKYLLHAIKHPLSARRAVVGLGSSLLEAASSVDAVNALAAAALDAPGASYAGSKSLPSTSNATADMGAPAVKKGKRSKLIEAKAKSESPHATVALTAPDTSVPIVTVNGASLHNLRDVTAHIPLKRLVALTGVSGSGKSTLARDVLLANVQMAVAQRSTKAGRDALAAGHTLAWSGCQSITGFESVDRVLEVDQTPIGKTPRSCPATYIGFWDVIRKLFADTLEAKARGYAANRFSFNTGEGRCPACEGQGIRTIGMSF